MKHSILGLTLAAASAFLVSACLVPEKFSAKVDVRPDASYTLRYSGSAVHALAAAQIKETGSLKEKDEEGLKREAEKLSKNPDFRKAQYKGKGRYDLEIEATRQGGQALRMLDIFSVRTDKNGVMTISSKEIKGKEKADLEGLGISINGTFEVSVPKDAEVISHNATSTPTFGFGTYSWKIGRVDQQALIKIRFKSDVKMESAKETHSKSQKASGKQDLFGDLSRGAGSGRFTVR